MAKAVLVLALFLVAGCSAPPGKDPLPSTSDTQSAVSTSQSSSSTASASSSASSSTSSTEQSAPPPDPQNVTWHLGENNTWIPSGPPPPCPDPLRLATPVDLATVTSILYPGQVRGNAFKGHGGFRFDNNTDNNVSVRIPFDAKIVRGSHAVRNGTDIDSMEGLEEQDGFEFIAPCGIMYTFGHLRRLTPEFQAVADSLPLIVGFNQTQYYNVDPPVSVHVGQLLATAVGFENSSNVFVDWGVLDLRQPNGKTLRPEWEAYRDGFDRYAVCWLDLLPPPDDARARALPGGAQDSGKESDYC